MPYRDPDKLNAKSQRQRARRVNAPVNDLTAKQWVAMKEAYQHRCVSCGKKQQRLTQDHLMPLSKGGAHTYSNIVPACRSCNSKKGAGAVLKPVQPLLLIA
jgi:5-methylcytosine-specific restriction endonuclease McrA